MNWSKFEAGIVEKGKRKTNIELAISSRREASVTSFLSTGGKKF